MLTATPVAATAKLPVLRPRVTPIMGIATLVTRATVRSRTRRAGIRRATTIIWRLVTRRPPAFRVTNNPVSPHSALLRRQTLPARFANTWRRPSLRSQFWPPLFRPALFSRSQTWTTASRLRAHGLIAARALLPAWPDLASGVPFADGSSSFALYARRRTVSGVRLPTTRSMLCVLCAPMDGTIVHKRARMLLGED